MVARRWRGVIPTTKAQEYTEYLERTGVRDYKATPGNRGVFVLRRIEGDRAYFEIFTLWDSLDAIRAFAGDEVERARYYPGADDYLIDREPTVDHFEVVSQ